MNSKKIYLVASIICMTTNSLIPAIQLFNKAIPTQPQGTTLYNASPAPFVAYFANTPTPSMIIINPEEEKVIPGEGTMIALQQLTPQVTYNLAENQFTTTVWVKQFNGTLYAEPKPAYRTLEINSVEQPQPLTSPAFLSHQEPQSLPQLLSLTIENHTQSPIIVQFTQSPDQAYRIESNEQQIIPYKQDILSMYTVSPTIINHETRGIKALRAKMSDGSLIVEPKPMWQTQ